MTAKYPAWHCQKCGDCIGYLGHVMDFLSFGFTQKLAHPHSSHDRAIARWGLMIIIAGYAGLWIWALT